MCFIKRVGLVGSCFLWQQITAFWKRESLARECFLSDNLPPFGKQIVLWESKSHRIILKKSQNLCQLTSLRQLYIKPLSYSKLSTQLTPVFLFRCNKVNVQSLFSSTACGGKPSLQFRFSTKSDSAFVVQLPFRTGSKPESCFSDEPFQIL